MKIGEFIGVMVGAAVVSAGVSYGMNLRSAHPAQQAVADTVEVPSVVGVSPEQARTLLETHGLLVAIASEKEDTKVDPGRICDQSPLEGSRVRRGETVRVEVARASPTIVVPNVVGRSAAKAKELTQAGFAPGATQYRSNDERRDGVVLEQMPPAGQSVTKGSKIDLAVNRVDDD
jgi:serine/threonine-protein kinase